VSTAVREPKTGPAPGIADEPTFERRGIDLIPEADRRGRPTDLLWMWAGALFNVEYVVYGALIVSFGLSFWQAALVIVVGNLSYLVTGLGSLQGPASGTSVFAITRAPFGPRGAGLVAVFHASSPLKIALIAVAAGIQLVLPLLGHGTMVRVLRWLVAPFFALFVVLAVLVAPKVHLDAGAHAGWETMTVALALVLSAGGYGWVMNANDYSRYLPSGASRRRIVWSVALGGYIPSTLLGLLGAAVATAVNSATDPISGLPQAFPGWFLIPYLAFVIVQLFAINSVDLYSSGLTLQALIPRIRRWQCVLIDTLVAAALTAVTVFSASFNTFITDFLLFMIVWIAPWVAIFLTDAWLRRNRYDARSLLSGRSGIYWRRGGVHLPGVVAQVAGMLAAASWLDTTVWKGPLSSATHGADFSVFAGAIVGGLVYYALTRRDPSRAVR
jgi:purine-cytosine permease-like protein